MPRNLKLDTPIARDPIDEMRVTVLTFTFPNPGAVAIEGSVGEVAGGSVGTAPGFTINQSFLVSQSGIAGLTFGELLDALTEGALLEVASDKGRPGTLE